MPKITVHGGPSTSSPQAPAATLPFPTWLSNNRQDVETAQDILAGIVRAASDELSRPVQLELPAATLDAVRTALRVLRGYAPPATGRGGTGLPSQEAVTPWRDWASQGRGHHLKASQLLRLVLAATARGETTLTEAETEAVTRVASTHPGRQGLLTPPTARGSPGRASAGRHPSEAGRRRPLRSSSEVPTGR